MIARITSFASKENQIIEWDERIPTIIYVFNEYVEKMYERLLNQLYWLLEKYPDVSEQELMQVINSTDNGSNILEKYGIDKSGIQIHLWAYKLKFKHPTKDEIMEFTYYPDFK